MESKAGKRIVTMTASTYSHAGPQKTQTEGHGSHVSSESGQSSRETITV